MSEWIVSVARRPAEARLSHLLCELRCRYKQAGMLADDGSYALQLTQLQIADGLGITPIHLNRMIRLLRERGLASVSRSAITINDHAGVVRLAEFDPADLHLDERDALPSPQSLSNRPPVRSERMTGHRKLQAFSLFFASGRTLPMGDRDEATFPTAISQAARMSH